MQKKKILLQLKLLRHVRSIYGKGISDTILYRESRKRNSAVALSRESRARARPMRAAASSDKG